MKPATPFDSLLKKATIKAIDGISRKAAKTERAAGGAVGKLLARWNGMDTTEKEQVVGIVIATATTAVTALSALKARRAKRSPVKKSKGSGLKKVKKALSRR